MLIWTSNLSMNLEKRKLKDSKFSKLQLLWMVVTYCLYRICVDSLNTMFDLISFTFSLKPLAI